MNPAYQILIKHTCTPCRGTGRISTEPADHDSEAYSQYLQSPTQPTTCAKCKGVGSVERVNPAWLRAAREAAGLSRKELATQCGVSYGYLTNLENGYAPATPKHLALYQALIP